MEKTANSKFPWDLVIFDWDGTLASSVELISASMVIAAKSISETITLHQGRQIIGLGLDKAIDVLLPRLSDPIKRNKMAETYKSEFYKNQHKVKLYDYALDVLQMLKDQNKIIALATGKSREGIQSIMEHFPVKKFFSITKSAEETASKPDPKMLYEILEETNVRPEQTIFIGDTTHDLAMAQNAKIAAMGILHGAHSLDQLNQYPHVKLLNSLKELKEMIAKADH